MGFQSAKNSGERYKEHYVFCLKFKFGKNNIGMMRRVICIFTPLNQKKFWKKSKRLISQETTGSDYRFFYEGSLTFLKNRGFGKHKEGGVRKTFVHVENKVVHTIDTSDIRDFFMEFTRAHLTIEVLEMLHTGGPQYLGDYKLSSLEETILVFEKKIRDFIYISRIITGGLLQIILR